MKNHLIVLTAPPASGKTYLVHSLIKDLNQKPLVLAPLKALVEECRLGWGENALVMTPEEWAMTKPNREVVIIDEFHLNFYWGDTFRATMWETFYEVSGNCRLMILMTATLNESMRQEISFYTTTFDSIYWADFGNQRLKYFPKKIILAPSSAWLNRLVLTLPPEKKVNLIFCEYRSEVTEWKKCLEEKGYQVWSCVGGEASTFAKKVQTGGSPQFIVATTVLSHGVNLPRVHRIWFTYKVSNLDFWIQMAARGGRRGEDFDIYCLDNPGGIYIPFLNNLLAILRLSFRMKRHELLEHIQAWFLKD